MKDVEVGNGGEGARRGDLVEDAVARFSTAAGGAVEIAVGSENGRSPREGAIQKAVEVVQDCDGASLSELEHDALGVCAALLGGAVEVAVGSKCEAASRIRAIGTAVGETVNDLLGSGSGHGENGSERVRSAVVSGPVEIAVGALHQRDIPRGGAAAEIVGEVVDGRDRLCWRERAGTNEGERKEKRAPKTELQRTAKLLARNFHAMAGRHKSPTNRSRTERSAQRREDALRFETLPRSLESLQDE